jgi:hypothetical protein
MVEAPLRSIQFRQIDPLCDPEWDTWIKDAPEATIFHTSHWAKVLSGTYGYVPHYFVAEHSGKRIGICLAEVNSWLTGRRASSLPFTDECVVLGLNKDAASWNEVLEFSSRVARTNKWKRVEFRGVPPIVDHAAASFYGHELDLRNTVEKLFANCESSVRRAVRKGERSGIVVDFERSRTAVQEYYRLHCLTRKKHGVPPQPFKFFEQIYLNIIEPGLGFVALGKLAGRVLAGAIFFIYEGKALYKFGASDPSADHFRPSNQVMWSAISFLVEQGSERLCFGRTSLHQEGLRKYKLGWGAKEKEIRYLQIKIKSKGYDVAPIEQGRDSNPLFSRLPLPVLKQIGVWAYPHVG